MGRPLSLLLVLGGCCSCALVTNAFAPPPVLHDLGLKAGGGGFGKRRLTSSSLGGGGLASFRPLERPTGWKSVVASGGGHGRSGGTGGGNGGSGGSGGDSFGWSKGGSGDDGEGDDGISLPADISNLLTQAGRAFSDLPPSVQKALASGGMTSALFQRYLELESRGGLMAWLVSMGLFRDRLLMDAYLMDKMGIEMAVGAIAQMVAEWDRRRERLMDELDFAFADLLTCLVANFAAVLIAAPSVAGAAAVSAAGHIPANMFQLVPPGGRPYSLAERAISPFLKVPTLFSVGVVASLLGYGTTNLLTNFREYLESSSSSDKALPPSSPPPSPPHQHSKLTSFFRRSKPVVVAPPPPAEIPVLKTSLAVGIFLAISTNIRYQLISGVIEERFIAKVFANNKLADHAASFVVRAGNTYIGSVQMISFLQYLGFTP